MNNPEIYVMNNKIRWNSQPLDMWRTKYASGKFIDLDGHLTHYVDKGEGHPVILLHGWFHDSQMWNKNINVIAQEFKVYAIDLWGFGYSTREIMDWGYQLYAHQLEAFIEKLGIKQASLVGQSFGAGISILFCTQHPEMVSKLALVSPAGLPNSSSLGETELQRALKQLVLNDEESRRLLLETMFIHDSGSISEDWFHELTRFHEIEGTNEVLLGNLKNNFFDGLSREIEELGEIDVPTLLIWGLHDKSINPERGIKMHRILKNSQLEIFKKSAHCANYEEPEKFNRIIMRFLKKDHHC
ncbi:MAG: alpha/beta hydrolase [Dehalococcoidales bacterium]|nr:alpha/beta hydrolase [Dehalococcoidales bacterium]